MGDESDVVWLTYDEASQRIGIKADSVRRRAAAKKWPRRIGNDKLARIGVPRMIIPVGTPVGTGDNPDISLPIRTNPDLLPLNRGSIPADPEILARIAVAEARLADALEERDRTTAAHLTELERQRTVFQNQISDLQRRLDRASEPRTLRELLFGRRESI